MGFLGSVANVANYLGSTANSIASTLGNVQNAVSSGIHSVSSAAGSVGKTIADHQEDLNSVGLGGVGKYSSAVLTSGAGLGHAVGDLVGSKSLGSAIKSGVNVVKHGIQFAGDVSNVRPIYSPISK